MTVPSIKSPRPGAIAPGEMPAAPGETLWAQLALTIVVLGLGYLSPCAANAQTPWDLTPEVNTPIEGRLYNLTTEPFVFRLHRSIGPVWTESYTVAPGSYRAVAMSTTGKSDILGVRGDGKGYVLVQYPSYDGKVTMRLPARNPSDNKLEPNWFCIKDINGYKQLIQADSEAAAREKQIALNDPTKVKRLTPEEVKDLKKSLRANWVLSDEGNAELTFRRGNTR